MTSIRRRLEAARNELLLRLGQREAVDSTERGRDEGDQAAATHNHALESADRERLTQILQEVREALARIAAGCYGRCADCRGLISPKRLQAIPWTPTCVDCAQVREANEPERASRVVRVRRPEDCGA